MGLPLLMQEGLCKYESKYASGAKVVGMKFVEKGNEEELKVMVTSSGPVAVAFDHRRRSFQVHLRSFNFCGKHSPQ